MLETKGTVYVDGKALSDFGLFTSSANAFKAPNPIFQKVHVEGRNGDLIINSGTFENVLIKYKSVIKGNFRENYMALRDFLFSKSGYCRIEDDFIPDRYRVGKPVGDLTPITARDHQTRIVEIQFDCKPQWFLKSGERPFVVSGGNTVVVQNPTMQTARPKITVSGIGTITINGATAQLTANNGATVIDSEIQETYEGTTNRNGDIIFSAGYPELKAGNNTISVPAGMSVSIVPNWWSV